MGSENDRTNLKAKVALRNRLYNTIKLQENAGKLPWYLVFLFEKIANFDKCDPLGTL